MVGLVSRSGQWLRASGTQLLRTIAGGCERAWSRNRGTARDSASDRQCPGRIRAHCSFAIRFQVRKELVGRKTPELLLPEDRGLCRFVVKARKARLQHVRRIRQQAYSTPL